MSATDKQAKALQAAAVAAARWVEATNKGKIPPGKEWVVTVTISADAAKVTTKERRKRRRRVVSAPIETPGKTLTDEERAAVLAFLTANPDRLEALRRDLAAVDAVEEHP